MKNLRPRMIGFGLRKDDKDALHDIITGGIEGGAGVVATDALIHNLLNKGGGGLADRLAATGGSIAKNFRRGNRLALLKKLGIGAGVGALATGAIGAGVSAYGRKKREEFGIGPIGRMGPIGPIRPGMIEFADRPRNNDGEFVANETGGADPNSMAAAYGPQAIQNTMRRSAIAAGGAAVGASVGANLITPGVKKVIQAGARRLKMLRAG